MSVNKNIIEVRRTARAEALEQGLRSWREIARRWNEQSGERITSTRCRQIAKMAERKIFHQLKIGGGAI